MFIGYVFYGVVSTFVKFPNKRTENTMLVLMLSQVLKGCKIGKI